MNGDLEPMDIEDPQHQGGHEDDDEDDDNLFNWMIAYLNPTSYISIIKQKPSKLQFIAIFPT